MGAISLVRSNKWVILSLVAILATTLIFIYQMQIKETLSAYWDITIEHTGISFIFPISWVGLLVFSVSRKRTLIKPQFWNIWLSGLLLCLLLSGVFSYFDTEIPLFGEANLGGSLGSFLSGNSFLYGLIRLTMLGLLVVTTYKPYRMIKVYTLILFKVGSCLKWLMSIAISLLKITKPHMSRNIVPKNSSKIGERSKGNVSIKKAPIPEIPTFPAKKPNHSVDEKKAPASKTPKITQAVVENTLIPHDSYQDKLDQPNPTKTSFTVHPGELESWALPPISVLKPSDPAEDQYIDQSDTAQVIEKTLGEYGIEVVVEEIKPGPVVTMFGLVPGWVRRTRRVKEQTQDGNIVIDTAGKAVVKTIEEKTRVKVDAITAREKDLALALAAPSIRIEAPIPGTSLVGIEVPNQKPSIVTLRSIMSTNEFYSMKQNSKLGLALGKGSGGDIAVADLAKMPHLLIAGSTGSGKSVCMNAVIACIIMQNSPWETRLLLIDPKRVELTPYNGIPHLLCPVIVDVDLAVNSLKGMVREMLRRYKVMEEAGARNIETFNKNLPPSSRMPNIVICVDELADLMMAASYDIEHSIIRLAQLGRATGIHLVVATQRPSVNVVTGLIKANFPSRISFAVASQVDSRTILDSMGAEKLLGRGDMLYQPQDVPKPRRIQGVYLSDAEVEDLVKHWHHQVGPMPPYISLEPPDEESVPVARNLDKDLGDELMDQAIELATSYNRLSTSLLQRRLRIGYPRAARLMDLLEEEGIVGSGESGKSREVLIGKMKSQEWEQ
ncbi:MAG: cell division protein FtsK [Chloroflexi bacterium]|nr:cell division protein FtsK [Chloroflexota bacterium]